MTVTVADILGMSVLRTAEPTVHAGQESMDRVVRWVHSAEIVDVSHLLRGGELVLTTGLMLPDDSLGLEKYVASLVSVGVSGLVVELTQRWTKGLPEALTEACRSQQLPLVSLSREVSFAEVTQTVGERIVDEHLYELRAVEQVHERFTALSVNSAIPAEILAEVTRASGMPVILESSHHHVLGYDAGPLAAHELLVDFERRSRAVAGNRRTYFDEASGWLVTSVGAKDDNWGRLILQTGQEPPYRHVVLVEQASAALALYRLHARQRDSIERQTHGSLLVALAAGDVTDDLLTRCSSAGVPLTGHGLVGLTMHPDVTARPSRFTAEGSLAEIAAAAAADARTQHVSALVAVVNDEVWMILATPRSGLIDKAVHGLAEELHRQVDVVIGCGAPVDDPHNLHHSLTESRHAARAARTRDKPVHRLEDIHVRGLLHLVGDDEHLDLFVQRELGPLLRRDEGRRTRPGEGLVDAVRALVTYPNSKSMAAKSLHLSRPAFYERLAKAESILAVDLNDGEVRTALHLALLAHEHGSDS